MKNFETYISAISAALVSIATGKAELCKAWKAAVKAALEQDNIEGLRSASEMLKEGAPKYWHTLIEQSADILYRNVKFVGQISWKKGVASDALAREKAIIKLDSIVFDLADKPKKEAAKATTKKAYNQMLADKLADVAAWLEKQKSVRDISLVTVLKAYADASLNDDDESVLTYINKVGNQAEADKEARRMAAIEAASAAQADADKAKAEAESLRRAVAELQGKLAEAEAQLTAQADVARQAHALVESREATDKKAASKLSRANRSAKPAQGELVA